MSEPPRPSDPVPPAPVPPSPPFAAPPPPSAAPKRPGIIETPEELRQRQIHEKEQHDDAKSAAVTAAAGIGCLGFALMPWLLPFVIFAIIVIIGIVIHAHVHWGGWHLP